MTTCPYCNAPLLAELSGHAICPRCGETVRTVDGEGTSVAPFSAPTAEPSGRTNRQIAAMILGVMLLMAAIALAFALYTTRFRRANDVKGQQKPAIPDSSIRAKPADWAGIGYIPDDVHALIGVDVAQLRQSEAGRALLRRLDIAGEVLVGPFVDHALVGLNLKELLPRFAVVVHSPTTHDHSRVTAVIVPKETKVRGSRILSKTTLFRLNNLDAWICDADDCTLIGAQLPVDFEAMPDEPRTGTARFTQLHALFDERLDDNAAFWLIGQIEPEITVVGEFVKLLPAPADQTEHWKKLRAIVLAVRPESGDIVLTLDIRAADAASTAAIGEWLERSVGASGVVVGLQTDGDWLRLRGRLSVGALDKIWMK
jgi:hypothetical protein